MSIFETTLILVALRNNIRVFLWQCIFILECRIYITEQTITLIIIMRTATEKTISPLHSLTQHDCLFKREPYSRVDHFWRRRIDLPD